MTYDVINTLTPWSSTKASPESSESSSPTAGACRWLQTSSLPLQVITSGNTKKCVFFPTYQVRVARFYQSSSPPSFLNRQKDGQICQGEFWIRIKMATMRITKKGQLECQSGDHLQVSIIFLTVSLPSPEIGVLHHSKSVTFKKYGNSTNQWPPKKIDHQALKTPRFEVRSWLGIQLHGRAPRRIPSESPTHSAEFLPAVGEGAGKALLASASTITTWSFFRSSICIWRTFEGHLNFHVCWLSEPKITNWKM